MISKTEAWIDSRGVTWATRDEAITSEIILVMQEDKPISQKGSMYQTLIMEWVVKNIDKIQEIINDGQAS